MQQALGAGADRPSGIHTAAKRPTSADPTRVCHAWVKATARDHNFEVAWAAYETSFLHHFNQGASTLDNNTRRAHLGCGGGVRGDLGGGRRG